MTSHELSLPHPSFAEDQILVVAAAYLGRFKGLSRQHTESDLKIFLRWSAEHRLDPLAARRADLERYVRWLSGDPALQAVHRLTAHLGGLRLLPHLHDRRRAGALSG